jgi:hypothetical protein
VVHRVLRDRLGRLEDRFFATVFFGSGLLFLGMLFSAAALVGAILMAFAAQPAELINSATFHFARGAVYRAAEFLAHRNQPPVRQLCAVPEDPVRCQYGRTLARPLRCS